MLVTREMLEQVNAEVVATHAEQQAAIAAERVAFQAYMDACEIAEEAEPFGGARHLSERITTTRAAWHQAIRQSTAATRKQAALVSKQADWEQTYQAETGWAR